jgi:hypothetical protein
MLLRQTVCGNLHQKCDFKNFFVILGDLRGTLTTLAAAVQASAVLAQINAQIPGGLFAFEL